MPAAEPTAVTPGRHPSVLDTARLAVLAGGALSLMLVGCGGASSPKAVTVPGPGVPSEIVYPCPSRPSLFPAGLVQIPLPGDEHFCAAPAGGGPPVLVLDDASVALTADGRREAWAYGGFQFQQTSLVVEDNTGAHQQTVWTLLGDPVGGPAWNPAGTKVAIAVAPQVGTGPDCSGASDPGEVAGGLWVVNAADGHRHHLNSSACGPVVWSPTGNQIAFATQSTPPKVEVESADGGSPTVLTANFDPALAKGMVQTLSWSPDGTSILADLVLPDHAAGSQLVRLNPHCGSPSTLAVTPAGGVVAGAVYSPDGHQIAIIEGPTSPTVSDQLQIVDPDGRVVRTIATGINPELPLQWVLEPADVEDPTPAPTTSTTIAQSGPQPSTTTPPGSSPSPTN